MVTAKEDKTANNIIIQAQTDWETEEDELVCEQLNILQTFILETCHGLIPVNSKTDVDFQPKFLYLGKGDAVKVCENDWVILFLDESSLVPEIMIHCFDCTAHEVDAMIDALYTAGKYAIDFTIQIASADLYRIKSGFDSNTNH